MSEANGYSALGDSIVINHYTQYISGLEDPRTVVRLIGCRSLAKPEHLRYFPKTKDDLKDFFIRFPDIFTIKKSGVVVLTKNVVNPESYDASLEIIKCIKFILKRKSEYSFYPIIQLHGSLANANAIVEEVKSPKALTKFLSAHQEAFTVIDESVILNTSFNAVFDATNYFLKILLQLGANSIISLSKLFERIKYAPKDVKKAVNSISALEQCLCRAMHDVPFFSIVNDTVIVNEVPHINGNNRSEPLRANLNTGQTATKNKPAPSLKSTKPEFCINSKRPALLPTPDLPPTPNKSELLPTPKKAASIPTPKKAASIPTPKLKLITSPYLPKFDNSTSLTCDEKQSYECLGNETDKVQFLYEQLLSFGPWKIMPISDLYLCKQNASESVKSAFGNSCHDLKKFLERFPDYFIVTKENILARSNPPRERWAPPTKGVEEPVVSLLVNFFKTYTEHGRSAKIQTIFSEVGRCFIRNNDLPLFDNSSQLEDFLCMFPHIFSVHDGTVINIMYNENSTTTTKCKKDHKVIPIQNDYNWKEDVLNKTVLVEDISRCREICFEILREGKPVAVDCEGFNLGADGKMSLIQIAKDNGEVYIFDIFTLPGMVESGSLKDVLESPNVIKVIHDCHNDSANLFYQFQVSLNNIFDTRIAHSIILNPAIANMPITMKTMKAIGFNNLCQAYGAPINIQKDELKDVYKIDPRFWLIRPLTVDMKAYAALDVACLVPHVYNTMNRQLDGMKQSVLDLSFKFSRLCF